MVGGFWPSTVCVGRASILDRGEEITDAEPDDCPVRSAGRWIVDPRRRGGAGRSGAPTTAARHGLWQLDPHIAYLSGDEFPAAARGFEVLQQLAFDERRLRQALGALDLAAPWRSWSAVWTWIPMLCVGRLGLRGSQSLTVVITRVGLGSAAQATAFVCRPSR